MILSIQHRYLYWQVYFMLSLAVFTDFMTDRGNTMNELAQMSSKIIRYTLFYSLVVSIFLLFLLSFDILVFIGVWIGCILSLIGFAMIKNMARSIAHEEKAGKRQGYSNYALRYLLYAFVMAVSAYLGISVLAILAGMLCQKAALLTYSFIERKN